MRQEDLIKKNNIFFLPFRSFPRQPGPVPRPGPSALPLRRPQRHQVCQRQGPGQAGAAGGAGPLRQGRLHDPGEPIPPPAPPLLPPPQHLLPPLRLQPPLVPDLDQHDRRGRRHGQVRPPREAQEQDHHRHSLRQLHLRRLPQAVHFGGTESYSSTMFCVCAMF